MKHTSKRLQALVLVLAMCVSFLQIPSFAAGHSSVYHIGSIEIDDAGTVTVTEYCESHKAGASCHVVSGKIELNKNEQGEITVAETDDNGASYMNKKASTKIEGLKTAGASVTINARNYKAATCSAPSTIDYVAWSADYSAGTITNHVTLAEKTGKHVYDKVPQNATYETLKDDGNYEFVSTTATCNQAGEATFAQKCTQCGNFIKEGDGLVTVPQGMLEKHSFIKEMGKDGKVSDKIFHEVLQAATCKEEGKERLYKECVCGAKLYKTPADTFTGTTLGQALVVTIDRLPHNYKHTVELNGTYVNDANVKAPAASYFKVKSVCADCEYATYNVATVVKAELVKAVKSEKACQPGTAVFKVTYNPSQDNKDSAKYVTEEITVPYYEKLADHDFGTPIYDEETVVKATCVKNGSYNMVEVCKVCGEKKIKSTHPILATGKHTAAAAKKENVVAATTKKGGSYDLVVRCADCGEIISSTHKTTAKIVVKASKINSVKNYKGKKAKVTVKKAASVTGYQIQYGTKKNFKGAKHVNTRKTSKYLTKLAKNKKYYVRVRTYKTVDGKLYFSSWSGAKTVTIKK